MFEIRIKFSGDSPDSLIIFTHRNREKWESDRDAIADAMEATAPLVRLHGPNGSGAVIALNRVDCVIFSAHAETEA